MKKWISIIVALVVIFLLLHSTPNITLRTHVLSGVSKSSDGRQIMKGEESREEINERIVRGVAGEI